MVPLSTPVYRGYSGDHHQQGAGRAEQGLAEIRQDLQGQEQDTPVVKEQRREESIEQAVSSWRRAQADGPRGARQHEGGAPGGGGRQTTPADDLCIHRLRQGVSAAGGGQAGAGARRSPRRSWPPCPPSPRWSYRALWCGHRQRACEVRQVLHTVPGDPIVGYITRGAVCLFTRRLPQRVPDPQGRPGAP